MRAPRRSAVILTACGLLAVAALLSWTGFSASSDAKTTRAAQREKYRRPADISAFPDSNPYSQAKAELGRSLFFDPILSGSQVRSCATCHNPALSWGDGLPRAVGEKQEKLPLRSPTLLNVAQTPKLGWDGHFRDLESVAFGPITAAGNMNLPEKTLIDRLSAIPGYVEAFKATFGDREITRRRIELALATFERTIVSGEAPFDRWIAGDESAISESAKRGFVLFNGKAGCADCHQGPSFTDFSFHDIGIARDDDIGRGRLFPTSVKLKHAFKVPTLRDVARRAPYMHDGSLPTLEAVVDEYNSGGIDRPSRSSLIHPLGLTDDEKHDLIAFLKTLTGKPAPFEVPTLPR